MPSYRSIMAVGAVRAGHDPREVEAAARRAVRLESWDIAVVSGQPRATARFTAADDDEARASHAAILTGVRRVAAVPGAVLAAVVRGRSRPIASAPAGAPPAGLTPG